MRIISVKICMLELLPALTPQKTPAFHHAKLSPRRAPQMGAPTKPPIPEEVESFLEIGRETLCM